MVMNDKNLPQIKSILNKKVKFLSPDFKDPKTLIRAVGLIPLLVVLIHILSFLEEGVGLLVVIFSGPFIIGYALLATAGIYLIVETIFKVLQLLNIRILASNGMLLVLYALAALLATSWYFAVMTY